MLLLILCCVILNCDFLNAFKITNHPMNVTVCSGTKANISCGYFGVSDLFEARPNWRIIKRNNNGHVISNATVSADDVFDDKNDGLEFIIVERKKAARHSYLSVGPVDDTYNNTSYQCIFTINDTIIESNTTGTITVIGVPNTPVLTYKSTLNEILVSWSPVGNDTVCGPVTYNITVMPSHGMMMMINDTAYNITGLYYNTNYTITVYATNNAGDGGPAMVTVKTKLLSLGAFKCNIISPSFNTIGVSCELLGNLARVNVTLICTSCTSSSEYHTTVNDSPIVIPNLPAGNYTVNVTAVDVNIRTVEVIMVSDDVTTTTTNDSSSSSEGSNIGIITGVIGGIIAVMVVIIIVMIIILIVVCHRKKDATDYKKERFQRHNILADSDNLPVYDDIKEAKESVPHQASASGQYAVPLIAVSSTPDKQQQYIPSVEYDEFSNSQNKSPQQHNQTSGYDEINENNSKVKPKEIPALEYATVDESKKRVTPVMEYATADESKKRVTPVMEYATVDKSKKRTTPVIQYAQVDKSKKRVSQEECKQIAGYDDTIMESKVPKITYAELHNLSTDIRKCPADKDAPIVYTEVI